MSNLIEVIVDPIEENILEVPKARVGESDQLQVSIPEELAPESSGRSRCPLPMFNVGLGGIVSRSHVPDGRQCSGYGRSHGK